MFILQIGGWFLFSCILMSFIEHQVHWKLMHRRSFLSAHTASFKRVFEAHALVHHKHYAEIFSDEPVARAVVLGEEKEPLLPHRVPPQSGVLARRYRGGAVHVKPACCQPRAPRIEGTELRVPPF